MKPGNIDLRGSEVAANQATIEARIMTPPNRIFTQLAISIIAACLIFAFPHLIGLAPQ
jgi:hypothetical protein